MKSHPARHPYDHRHLKMSRLSFWQRIHAVIALPVLSIIILAFVFTFVFTSAPLTPEMLSYADIVRALGATFFRILAAYLLATAVSLPLAILVHKNATTERVLLPLFDIVQSVPVLAFFPVIILFFVRYDFLNGAAIFVIFLSMLWNIVFNVVGGLKVIPTEIISAAHVFRIRGLALIRQILLPATFPYLVIGSLLAWAQGWNIIIVAEVLHTYIPGGSAAQDLFGIGSVLVNAASSGHHSIFIAAIAFIIAAIAVMNFFVWQKLLHYAEAFRFE